MANASTCSSGGGYLGSGYYYAGGWTSQGDRYGVAGGVRAGVWSYFSGSNGHSTMFLDLTFDDGTGGSHHTEVGVGIGTLNGKTVNIREVFFEVWTDTYTGFWVNNYPIPDNDHTYAKNYNYQSNGDGTYSFYMSEYSPYYGFAFTYSQNVGPRYHGTISVYTENAYVNNYNGNCNGVSDNSHTSIVYSNAISTNPTWYSWTGSCSKLQNAPYVMDSSGCPANWDEYGA